MDDLPWHEGERRAQAIALGRPLPGGAGVRSFMPDQHRLFFASLPWMVAGTLDGSGAPTATLLTGAPGFVASPDPVRLEISATATGPDADRFATGAAVGLIGLQPQTRRRNRANGRIAAAGPGGFEVAVAQSFGNCPQYIWPRALAPEERAGGFETFEGLDEAGRAQVAAADTFFVATASGEGVENGGVDVSHRGGPPGFVEVSGDVLTIPDYRGNRYFNTLGNLLLEPRAALLFVDFAQGRLLHLKGTTEVLWEARGLPHAERAWRFRVANGWRGPAGIRLAEA